MRYVTRKRAFAGLVLLCVLLWIAWPGRGGRLVFRPFVAPAKGLQRGLQPFIRFGRVVSNAALEYPASFNGFYKQACSGTLIGRDTILMSAHCLFKNDTIKVETPWGEICAACEQHPHYQGLADYDVALCKLLEKGPIENGFEQIVRPPFQLDPAETITVSGWGDTAKHPYTLLLAKLKFMAGYSPPFKIGLATGTEQGAIIVALGEMTPQGGVQLENGDSGGAAYVGDSATRRIAGINSKPSKDEILLANLSEEETGNFIEAWATRLKAHICGRDISQDAGCRQ